eukprot:scaffold35913_cov62-Attheya_sp.AAC.2
MQAASPLHCPSPSRQESQLLVQDRSFRPKHKISQQQGTGGQVTQMTGTDATGQIQTRTTTQTTNSATYPDSGSGGSPPGKGDGSPPGS